MVHGCGLSPNLYRLANNGNHILKETTHISHRYSFSDG